MAKLLGCLLMSDIIVGLTTFNIDTSTLGPLLRDEFLSVTIDASLGEHWGTFDFDNTRVNTLAYGLKHSILRYGGTAEDRIYYNMTGSITMDKLDNNQTYVDLNLTEFSEIANFALRNKWKFVFGLNEQYRYDNNTWNPNNAKELMQQIVNANKTELVYAWELGNEPDEYPKHGNEGWYNITAQQNAHDFNTLYDTIMDVYQNVDKKPLLFGDDIAGTFDYLEEFVKTMGDNQYVLDTITWHHYYGNSQTYTLQDFISVKVLDSLITKLNESITIRNTYYPGVPIALGETSSTYGGGTSNYSSSFVAGFMWLDKLGLSSIWGLNFVARQDFWGGKYALIGDSSQDYMPNPDYYSSYLFKNLVGNKVLYVENEFDLGRNIRIYAFCTRMNNNGSIYHYDKGSITVLFLNLYNTTQTVNFNLTQNNINPTDSGTYYDYYSLTSYKDVINSESIYLNGEPIIMNDSFKIPTLTGKFIGYGSWVTLDALSYGFIVMNAANASACI